jgi:hypothetical protein
MAGRKHKPEEIVAKLRQVDVLTSQGRSVAEAVRTIGVNGGYLLPLWTAFPLQVDFKLNCLASCKHLSGVTREGRGAQMGNPLAHASTGGRPLGSR